MKKIFTTAILMASLLSGSAQADAPNNLLTSPELLPSHEVVQDKFIEVMTDDGFYRLSYEENSYGEAVYQGDIILGDADDLQNQDSIALFGLRIKDPTKKWPNGVMRYRIAANLPNKARVRNAMKEWEFRAGVSFTEINDRTGNYVEFIPGNGCSSRVGMRGGKQYIRLANGCLVGQTIHEIGHAFGLHHEQARSDRDNYVKINFENIEKGRASNFETDPTSYKDVGEYCYESIMHYGNYAFSKYPRLKKTIESIPPGIRLGQRDRLANCDAETIAQIYSFADSVYDDDQEMQSPKPSAFKGKLKLIPKDCEEARKCYLANDIFYYDPHGVVWKASKRNPADGPAIKTGFTDGASIPFWAQPFIGRPFDPDFIIASVLHDHYTYEENYVRNWRQTHRMFYDALIDSGLPMLKAKIMYFAVYLGGPKWTQLVPGENCGPGCINDAIAGNDDILATEENVTIKFADNNFETEAFLRDFRTVATVLQYGSKDISLSDLENIAQNMRPDNFYYSIGDVYNVVDVNDPILSSK